MSLCRVCRVKRESERLSLASSDDHLKALQKLNAETRQSSISSEEASSAAAGTSPPGEEESDHHAYHSNNRFGHFIHSFYSRLRHPIHGSSHRSETGHLTRTFNEWSIDFVKDAMGWLLRHTKSRHALIVGGGLMLMNTLIIRLGIPGEMCRCMENNSCFLYTLLRKMNLIVFCS
ncbi:unnamed protein product [Sphagnum jensenii]|uniref:Uncharacterized protein n=1 Tax=Sphagnum jensenii TaxID=128206 RepID=A0ABP0WAT0_9BRYO